MKKPENWYVIRAECEYSEYQNSNLIAPSKRWQCIKSKKFKKLLCSYEALQCNWNRCPILRTT